MENTTALPADGLAERIVRHFQADGFAGVSEALIIRVGLRQGDRKSIDAAFEEALEAEKMPPVHECFEIRAFGHYSAARNFAEAKAALQADFAAGLRMGLPSIYFDPAPVLIDDALATGTRYDAMVKLRDNIGAYAYAILLNDPDSSFLDYLGTHHGTDWQKIMGDFETTAVAFAPEIDIL